MVELIAERQSAKENKDDSANNPVVSPSVSAPQVPVVAPQDPGSAPGPSDASLEPLASTSGLQQPPQHAIASPRGRSGERVTSERSRHASPSFQDRLRLHIDDVRRQLSNTMEIDDLYRSQGRLPPDQVSHDIGYLQDRLSHLQSSLADSLASSLGISTSTSAHAVASPAPTPVASGSSTSRFSSRHDRRYDQRVASSDLHALSGRPCSRESTRTSPRHPSSQRFSSSRRSLSPRRTPSPTQRRSASRRTPSPTKRRDTSRRTPSPAQRSSSRRTPSPQASCLQGVFSIKEKVAQGLPLSKERLPSSEETTSAGERLCLSFSAMLFTGLLQGTFTGETRVTVSSWPDFSLKRRKRS